MLGADTEYNDREVVAAEADAARAVQRAEAALKHAAEMQVGHHTSVLHYPRFTKCDLTTVSQAAAVEARKRPARIAAQFDQPGTENDAKHQPPGQPDNDPWRWRALW